MNEENSVSWKEYWIPEAKHYPGLYFLDEEKVRCELYKTNCTRVIKWAKKYKLKEDCQKACDNIKYPDFIPVQHSFIE